VLALRNEDSAGEIVRHALLTPVTFVLFAGTALAAAVVVVVASLVTPASARVIDAVALSLAVATAFGLARGVADVETVGGGGTAALILLLPVAVAALAALAAVRLLAPTLRLLARVAPGRRPVLRFAAVTAARRPGPALAAAAFLVVSVAFALFATSYRETLVRGQREQAAFALGADVVLREDLARLIAVREVATPSRVQALPNIAARGRVLRASGNVPGLAATTGVTVLGLEPGLVANVRGWRADFSPVPLHELAAAIRPHSRVALRGVRLPAAARVLQLDAHSSVSSVRIEAVVRLTDGRFTRLQLGSRARAPRELRGGLVVALRLVPPSRIQERGADAGRPVVGALRLGSLRAGRHVLTDFEGWIGTGGARVARDVIQFTLSDSVETIIRPRQVTDALPVPVITSRRLAELAGPDAILPLQVAGVPLRVRIVGTARRFPSTRRDFAVADRRFLETALNVAVPGAGVVSELWLDVGHSRGSRELVERLRRAPWDVLVADARSEREASLRADPLARMSLLLLVLGAVAAIALALVAVTLAALGDVRDDRPDLHDLETQGAAPLTLRRVARFRQLAVVVFGVAGGLVAGLALTKLVIATVVVAAGGERPQPPLVLTVDVASVAVATGALAAISALIVLFVTVRAFAGPEAGRAGERP
jgi:hypothetical protein